MTAAGGEPGDTPPSDFCAAQQTPRILRAGPASYRNVIPALLPGDTLLLAPGNYPRLTIANP
jgi:hypothetical protein